MADETNNSNWISPLFTETFKALIPSIRNQDGTFETETHSPQAFASQIVSYLGLRGQEDPGWASELITWGHKDPSYGDQARFAWDVAKAMPEEYRKLNLVEMIDWDMVYKLWSESTGKTDDGVAAKIDKKLREDAAAFFSQLDPTGVGLTPETTDAAFARAMSTDISTRTGLSIRQSTLAQQSAGTKSATDIIDALPSAEEIAAGTPIVQPQSASTGFDPWSATSSDMSEQEWLRLNAGKTVADLYQQFGESSDTEFSFATLPSSYRPKDAALTFNPRTALNYIWNLDRDQIFDLQENLARAGYFDSLGQQYGTAGSIDAATQSAWNLFLTDAAQTGTNPGKLMETKLTSYVRNRAAVSGFVGSDPATISQTIRNLGVQVIGRGLNSQEEMALMKSIRNWEREAALGPTFVQDNFQVDVTARATEYMEKQFESEKWTKDLDTFMKKGA